MKLEASASGISGMTASSAVTTAIGGAALLRAISKAISPRNDSRLFTPVQNKAADYR
jgi:hypothetical protein